MDTFSFISGFPFNCAVFPLYNTNQESNRNTGLPEKTQRKYPLKSIFCMVRTCVACIHSKHLMCAPLVTESLL